MTSKPSTILAWVTLAVVAVVGLSWWLGRAPKQAFDESEFMDPGAAPVDRSTVDPVLAVNLREPVQAANNPLFADRLADAEKIADPTRRKLRQAEIYAEWIEQDFSAAFEHMAIEGFDVLFSLPGLAKMIADRVDVADWVMIADRANHPDSALPAVGKFLSPAKLVEFAAATQQVDPSRIRTVAGVMGGLLAGQNLDSALRYAGGLAEIDGASGAYAGIIDQLAGNNSTEQAREIFRSLPDSIQLQDSVLFAYGNALRDVDPPEAIATLSAIADPQYKKLALVAFSRNVEASSPAAAIQAVVLGLGIERGEAHISRVLATWSNHDSAAARAFVDAENWGSESQRKRLVAVVDKNTSRVQTP